MKREKKNCKEIPPEDRTMNYCRLMSTFLFKRSWGYYLKHLSDEDAGKLIKAVYLHVSNEEPVFSESLRVIYEIMIADLEHNSYKYLAKSGLLNEDSAEAAPVTEEENSPGNREDLNSEIKNESMPVVMPGA